MQVVLRGRGARVTGVRGGGQLSQVGASAAGNLLLLLASNGDPFNPGALRHQSFQTHLPFILEKTPKLLLKINSRHPRTIWHHTIKEDNFTLGQ